MKDSLAGHEAEFEELVGDIAHTTQQMSDPVAIGAMLYSIAQEKNSTNLLIRDINAKFDVIISKIRELEGEVQEIRGSKAELEDANLSERDQEVLDFIKGEGKVNADILKEKFQYRGSNAASARLSKLFKEGHLEKTYSGRRVYYRLKS
ncbi:MAG: hypothetical protein ABIH11_02770 [Candidatus Altiarchaeota archaeon]